MTDMILIGFLFICVILFVVIVAYELEPLILIPMLLAVVGCVVGHDIARKRAKANGVLLYTKITEQTTYLPFSDETMIGYTSDNNWAVSYTNPATGERVVESINPENINKIVRTENLTNTIVVSGETHTFAGDHWIVPWGGEIDVYMNIMYIPLNADIDFHIDSEWGAK